MEVCSSGADNNNAATTRNPLQKLTLNECAGGGNRGPINATQNETEITCLSPCSPEPPTDAHPESNLDASAPTSTTQPGDPTTAQIFAAHLQMKLKSHLEESSSSSCSSSEEYYTISSGSHEDDSTANNSNSNSEIFYDFDDVVTYGPPDEELTSDYGTGGSNSTIVGGGGSTRSNSSSGSSDTGSEEGGGGSSTAGECSSSSGGSSVKGVGKKGEGEESGESEEEVERSTVRRYGRSSSLKSGKTPPGTPMKKIVRFADAMGLDLTDIKVFLDEIPKVPKEAYRDLHIPDYNGPTSGSSPSSSFSDSWLSKPFGALSLTRSTTLNFVPLFHQPVSMPDFFDKIRDQKVLLENAFLTQEAVGNTQSSVVTSKHVIKGTVRVMNLDFHKSVYVRYTYNDWKEFVDFQATYIQGSCDGFSDRFEFRIEIDESRLPPPYVRDHDDAKITFACRFHCQGSQFWDNNNSRNYVFQHVPLCTNGGANSTASAVRPSMFASSSRYSSFDDFDYTCGRIEGSSGAGSNSASVSTGPTSTNNNNNNSAALTAAKNNFDFLTMMKNNAASSDKSIVQQQVTPLTSNHSNSNSISSNSSSVSSTNTIGLSTSCGSAAAAASPSSPNTYASGGGGGSHLSGSMYSPTGFYEPAYGCYNNYGSACFY